VVIAYLSVPILFIAIIFSDLKAEAQSSLCEQDSIWGKQKKDIYDFQKEEFNSNLAENCQRLLKYDTKSARAHFENGELKKTKDWDLSMIPEEPPRQFVFDQMRMARYWGLTGKSDVKSFLNDNKKAIPTSQIKRDPEDDLPLTGKPLIKKLKLQIDEPIDTYGAMSLGIQVAKNPVFSAVACTGLTLTKSIPCGQGVSKIIDWLKVDFITLPDVLDDVLQNQQYESGIAIAAKKIIAKGESRQPGPSHLFEDLYQSFIEGGASKKDAQKMSWDTIGIISTGGANTGSRLQSLRDPAYSDKSLVSLLAIADTIPLLDHLNREKDGETYSFPPGMKFNCDNGKPYHFLMFAYLSHRLVTEEGMDPEAAAAASFLTAKGYQMMASHGSGRSNDTASVYPPFHEENNLKRMDLSHDAAGALYGATGYQYDIDSGVKELIRASNPSPNLKLQPKNVAKEFYYNATPSLQKPRELLEYANTNIKNISNFNDVMVPDSVFKFFKNK
jgi:hypothetical protein